MGGSVTGQAAGAAGGPRPAELESAERRAGALALTPLPGAGARAELARLGGESGLFTAISQGVGELPAEAPEPWPWMDDVPWSERPLGARPISGTEDALGRSDYGDALGRVYRPEFRVPVRPEGWEPPPAQRGYESGGWLLEQAALAEERPTLADRLLPFDPSLPPLAGLPLREVLDGAWQGISAPGRAWRGEAMTNGDFFAAAGFMVGGGALSEAPEGALRAGALRTGAREAAEAALRPPAPRWDLVQAYRGEGSMLPYQHIMAGHRFIRDRVGSTGDSMFARAVGQSDLRAWALELQRSPASVTKHADGSWTIVGFIDQSGFVGYTQTGVATNRLRLHLDSQGFVRSMYPF